MKVTIIGRKRFQQTRRHPSKERVRLLVCTIEQRFRSQHREGRQRCPSKNDAVRPDETVFADRYWSGRLAVVFQVNGVCQNLRGKPGKRGELTDRDGICGIDEVPVRDGRVALQDEFGPTLLFVREMRRRCPRGKTSDPIAPANGRVRLQMHEIEVLADREMADAGFLFHDQLPRQCERQSDATGGVKLVSEYGLKEQTAHRPREQRAKEH